MENNAAYRALDQIGWGKYNLILFFMCGIALVVYESMFVGLAYILQGAHDEWGTSSVFLGIMASFYSLGMMLGNLTWGFLSDKKGRKIPFRISSILTLTAIVMICLSIHPYMMCASIFVLGYSLSGELSLSATVFCEFCPPSKRHLLALFIGAILVSVIALIVVFLNNTQFYDWRIICIAMLVVIIISTSFRFFIEESPPFLCRNKNILEAEKILNHISMVNKKEEFSFDNMTSILNPVFGSARESTQQSLLTEIQEDPPISVLLKRIFGKRLLSSTLRLAFSMSFAILAFASLINFMPELLNFMSRSDAYIVMMIQQAFGVPGALLGAFLVKTKLGRKWTAVIGFTGAAVFDFLFILSQEFYYATIFSSFIFLFTNMGYSALYTLASESFPTQVRSTGTNFLSIFSRIGGISGPIISGILLANAGGAFVLMCLLAAANIGCAVIISTMKETRTASESNKVASH